MAKNTPRVRICTPGANLHRVQIVHIGGRTGLVFRASDSGSGDPGSILGRIGVLFP